jgi:putative phosphonate metabolism protein
MTVDASHTSHRSHISHAWNGQSRFAIYYAPPRESVWWRAGCAWLGRDPETRETLSAPQPAGLAQTLAELTSAPRRYGWHGTLVPPFRLAPGVSPEALCAAAQQWAATRTRFDVAAQAATLGRFVALRPVDDAGDAALRELAADALRTLAPLRAAQTGAERARRLDASLTAQQRANVEAWGYPYVFDEFRFHMTLSDSLDDAHTRETLAAAWNAQMRDAGPLPVDGIALFVEPHPGAPFALWRRAAFRDGERRA